MSDVRRIFVALPVSRSVERGIAEWQKKYRNLPVRWLAPKNLHVTVVPPWAEAEPDVVVDALRGLEGTIGQFPVTYTLVRYGPTAKEPRLIWAEGETPDQIFALKHSIERALARTPEGKPFRLHLTVARFRPEQFASFKIQKIWDTVEWVDESIRTFMLMESHRSRDGADYTVLQEFRL